MSYATLFMVLIICLSFTTLNPKALQILTKLHNQIKPQTYCLQKQSHVNPLSKSTSDIQRNQSLLLVAIFKICKRLYSSLGPRNWWHHVRIYSFFNYSIFQQCRHYLRTVLHKGDKRLLSIRIP